MIASLAGTLADKSAERVVVDVGGVGYAVHVSLQSFADLPATGAAVRLLVLEAPAPVLAPTRRRFHAPTLRHQARRLQFHEAG